MLVIIVSTLKCENVIYIIPGINRNVILMHYNIGSSLVAHV